MTRKIFRYAFFVGISTLLLCAVLFFALEYTTNIDEAKATLAEETACVARGLEAAGEDYLTRLEDTSRVTWIAADGSVLYDNKEASGLPNQADCPEVRDALQTGTGESIRRSESSGTQTLYTAERTADGSVIRLAKPMKALRSALLALSPILWAAALVLMISGVISFRAARQILRPVNELNLDAPDKNGTYPELAPLVERIQEQNLTIQEQMDELNRHQRELSTLTDNMSEGFVLLDREGVVLSANRSALHLIPGAETGKPLPELDHELHQTIADALAGQRAEGLVHEDGQSWAWIASPVSDAGVAVGALLLMMDVTEREQRERLRQEFSANVSHELKTPLTSISGFAELMMQGLVSGEKVREFAGDIYRESQRLITLVGDIIKLSKLDEEGAEPEFLPVDLCALAQDTLDSLRPVAAQQQVEMSLVGEHAEVLGAGQVLGEMIYNLVDNAIKYNRPGGSLRVTVADGEEVCLSVSDTGVGIPYASQNRVFERFYRVDKSHSKEIGGTGLGLSIVKHGALLHNARVELESEPGVGTTVRLFFPKRLRE